ncbi:MAG: methylmalonyl Co-A mutase-associated GTPase MeaB [Bacteroidetes bacterium]|nr:methylmalonyl Co-A mutase-associated GTPase MeaB [Bacteroidota bacterium]HET6243951.1 methylmalonyl Co-A mutase-associated GTPase MeaB [Bacteroidia bacterium]
MNASNKNVINVTPLKASEYFNGIISGNRVSLSRAITLIESSLEKHQAMARELVELCLPYSGNSIRIGITGAPGAGKSTFIDSFGSYLTSHNKKVAVLAIDPSSSKAKGSILGDKTRMDRLAIDPSAFIRPSPSSGSLGGVAKTTRETIILCEAAGFDFIIVETVGVGQSEIAVHSMVDFFLLIMIAGAGDELQGIKRGIMEMADAIAINKADGDNLTKAKAARAEFSHALHLFPPSESGWVPRVETCSALSDMGIDNIWKIIEEHHLAAVTKGYFDFNREQQSIFWMYDTITENLKSSFFNQQKIKDALPLFERKIKDKTISSYAAAVELLELFKNRK